MKKISDSIGIIDRVLSSTQRKTPTVVHKRFSVERIRKFYIRKVKFVQQNFNDYILEIVSMFPSIDYVHPFFRDLLNLMFQRQHYKLALSRLTKSKKNIDIVCNNFVKLLKNGNSLYTCKQLKKEALGRMCTIIKKLNKPLIFLEKLRRHLESLPEIDPHRKCVVVSGATKVGKSSFLNKVTRAHISIGNSRQQNNFVLMGHMKTNFSRLQILEINNLAKMVDYYQSSFFIHLYRTFLNLDCILVHLIDFSEFFSKKLSKQVELFKNLSMIKPKINIIIILTKTDLAWEKFMDQNQKAGLNYILKSTKINEHNLKASFHDEIGIQCVKNTIINLAYKPLVKIQEIARHKQIKYQRPLDIEFLPNLKKAKIDNEVKRKKTYKDFSDNIYEKPEKFKRNSTLFSNSIAMLHKIDLINKKKKIDGTTISHAENEDKNREIKNEKIYIETKIIKLPKVSIKSKNFIYIGKYENNNLAAVCLKKNNSL